MSGTTVVILVFVFVAAVYLVRYLLRVAVNKGSDAVSNAVRKKKAETAPAAVENLANRFKAPAQETDDAPRS